MLDVDFEPFPKPRRLRLWEERPAPSLFLFGPLKGAGRKDGEAWALVPVLAAEIGAR